MKRKWLSGILVFLFILGVLGGIQLNVVKKANAELKQNPSMQLPRYKMNSEELGVVPIIRKVDKSVGQKCGNK